MSCLAIGRSEVLAVDGRIPSSIENLIGREVILSIDTVLHDCSILLFDKECRTNLFYIENFKNSIVFLLTNFRYIE